MAMGAGASEPQIVADALSKSVGSRLFAIGAYKSGETFWPIQRAMKRLQNGSEDGIYAYGVVIAGMAAEHK